MARGRAVGATIDTGDVVADLARFGQVTADRLDALNRRLTDETIKRARAWAARIGRQQSRAASTLTPARTGAAGATLPASPAWNVGAEFGSNRYPQFPRWRGSGPGAGYFLYPALGEVNMLKQSSDLIAELVKEFDRG